MSENTNESVEEIYKCLSQQLSEFELLKSMYPVNDEIILSDNNIIEEIATFLEKKSDYMPNHLDYTLNIVVDKMKLEICINLPTLYPKEEPDIYVRCNQLNRQQESTMNACLSEYIKINHFGEVCLHIAISWLQDNVNTFSTTKESDEKFQEDDAINNHNEHKFVRLWVYSHHIYNKRKRENIVKKARELKLNGFCLPGKPGIICVEGLDNDCKEWWKDIKSMTWKRIVIRNTEIFASSDPKDYQKFHNFEEIVFKNPVSKSNKHSDMSEFCKYMEERGLSQAFNEVFGFGAD